MWSSEERLTSVTDALNRTAEITYDDAGRPETLALPGNRAITMTHDANGNLLSLSPPGRGAHLFTYDSVDLPATMLPPGPDGAASAASCSFDTDRRLRAISEGGRNITIDYDSKGRASTISDLVNQLTLEYDSAGRLASIANAAGPSLTYAWDGFLELGVTWSGTITGSLAWTYDNELRVTSESVNGSAIPFGYDPDSLLLSAGPVTLTRSAASGQVTQVATGTATEQYSYNEFGETNDATAKYAGAPLLSLVYTRDRAGRITSITASGDTTAYEYDVAGRLSRVTRGGADIAEYDYDANGNRLAHRWIGGSAAATYDEQDRLLTYGDATYTYTPDGMLQSRTLAGATTTYDYDVFGNLRTVVLPGGSTINYAIDGENRRVGKKVNGTLTQGFLYSGPLQIVAELDGTNTVVTRFIYGSRANVPDAMIRGGVTYRIFSDHLGSPRLIVNATTGAVAQELRYDEFGNVLFDTNPGFQPFGFAGGLYDRDTRLVRFGARDYDSHTGRWTTMEPLGFVGGDTNLYAYVANDPVNWVDPSGLIKIRDMDCLDLANEIKRLTSELAQRAAEEMNWQRDLLSGVKSRPNIINMLKYAKHKAEFASKQRRINNLLKEFDRRPCKPDLDTWRREWASAEYPGDDYIWQLWRQTMMDQLMEGPPKPKGPSLIPVIPGGAPVPVFVPR